MKRIVLAYSGSLASSAAVSWLREQHGAEVVTVTLDVGQERELAAVRERALALGAVRAHVVDGRDELVRDYLLPALAAGALESGSLLVRPAVAKRLVDVARMESASAVAHAAAVESAAGDARSMPASVRSILL
jgi:argininosuccinate synthase